MTATGDVGTCATVWLYVYGATIGYANDKSGEPSMGVTSHLVKGDWTQVHLNLDGPYGYHSTANHPNFKPTQQWSGAPSSTPSVVLDLSQPAHGGPGPPPKPRRFWTDVRVTAGKEPKGLILPSGCGQTDARVSLRLLFGAPFSRVIQ